MWSVTTWLIVINVAVFLLNSLLVVQQVATLPDGQRVLVGQRPLLEYYGCFTANAVILHLQLWRFITFQFLHAGTQHIFFNMLSLYFFGPMIENYLGSKRFTAFYLLCGVAGAVSYLGLWGVGLLASGPATPLVGASAGIFGILIAAACVAPDAQVMLMFPPIPMRLKTLVWIMLGLAVWAVFTNGHNAGGEAAHLGGAVLGFVLIRYQRVLDIFDFRFRRRMQLHDRWGR